LSAETLPAKKKQKAAAIPAVEETEVLLSTSPFVVTVDPLLLTHVDIADSAAVNMVSCAAVNTSRSVIMNRVYYLFSLSMISRCWQQSILQATSTVMLIRCY